MFNLKMKGMYFQNTPLFIVKHTSVKKTMTSEREKQNSFHGTVEG